MKKLTADNRVKTFRWLFYMSVMPFIGLFVFPMVAFSVPLKFLFKLEILGVLTVGVLFALYFLGVNIYGLFVDKSRKKLYMVMVILLSSWVIWAIITWSNIEYMDYLLR
jgi:hypothetical protein